MFYDELQRICAAKGIRVTNLCEELGISSGNMSKWKAGSAPRSSTLKKIADRLNVSVSELLGETKKAPVESDKGDRSAMEQEFIELYHRLTPDQKKTVSALITALLDDKE